MMPTKSQLLYRLIRSTNNSIERFAELCGVSTQLINNAICGCGISKTVCNAVSKYFGVDYSWLESSREMVKKERKTNGRKHNAD